MPGKKPGGKEKPGGKKNVSATRKRELAEQIQRNGLGILRSKTKADAAIGKIFGQYWLQKVEFLISSLIPKGKKMGHKALTKEEVKNARKLRMAIDILEAHTLEAMRLRRMNIEHNMELGNESVVEVDRGWLRQDESELQEIEAGKKRLEGRLASLN